MASASKKNEIDQQDVDVAEVRKRWRVQEDFGLASHLQDEEYLEHYDLNRTERRQMHHDIKYTKGEQAIEDKYAAEYWEQVRLDQEKEDEKIAKELQRMLELEKNAKLQQLTKEDEELARRLQQEEASKSKQSGAPIVLPSAMTPETMSAIQYAMREETKATKPVSLDSGMTPETMRAIHEIVNADRVRKSAVEAQDAELARWLQRRESEPNFSGQRLGMCREQVENEQNLRGLHAQQLQQTSPAFTTPVGNLIDFDDDYSSSDGQSSVYRPPAPPILKPPRPSPPTQWRQNSLPTDRIPNGMPGSSDYADLEQQRQGPQMRDPRQLGGVAVLPPLPNHKRN